MGRHDVCVTDWQSEHIVVANFHRAMFDSIGFLNVFQIRVRGFDDRYPGYFENLNPRQCAVHLFREILERFSVVFLYPRRANRNIPETQGIVPLNQCEKEEIAFLRGNLLFHGAQTLDNVVHSFLLSNSAA